MGGNAVDDLDLICKHWKHKRHCNDAHTLAGTCSDYGFYNTENYLLNDNLDIGTGQAHIDISKVCLDSDSGCPRDSCRVDAYYAEEIRGYFQANSDWASVLESALENRVCNPHGTVVSAVSGTGYQGRYRS